MGRHIYVGGGFFLWVLGGVICIFQFDPKLCVRDEARQLYLWTGSLCVTSSPEEKCLHVGTGDTSLIPKSLLLCRKISNIEFSFKVCAWLLVVILCACADECMQCSMRACNGLLNPTALFHTQTQKESSRSLNAYRNLATPLCLCGAAISPASHPATPPYGA
jgi:hypothetical protein